VTGCSRKGQCERRNDISTKACLQDLIISVPRIIFGGHRRGAEEREKSKRIACDAQGSH